MANKPKTYEFGDFRFVPSESLLLKLGEAVPLPHKALNLLEQLVENAGSVVTKDDLLRDVWDDIAVEESAVSRTVFLVRTALGDDPKNHTFIQTVPKRGYRFVAKVSTLNGSNGSAIHAEHIADAVPVSTVEPRRFSAVHLAAVLVILAAATTGAYFGFFSEAPASKKHSLLVMPVTSAGHQDGDELLENGIADALIHRLASSRDIKVRPLSATRSYSGTTTDPIQAGREQKVNRVFSASYQRADGKVRITARLINVETAEIEEFYKSETGEAGVFAIQDAIAAEIGDRIAARLGAAAGRMGAPGTANEEAYRHYFHAMALFDRRNGLKAVESFEKAIDLDPNFARAWVGKAVALGSMPSLGGSTASELYEKTAQAAGRALALDARSAEAHSALCAAKLGYAHDFAGAERACAQAMELAPDSPIVLQSYSFLLISQGRLDEGIKTIQAALEIEPTSFYSQTIYAHALYYARRYDEAYTQYVRLGEVQPDRLPTYERMIRTLEAGGREPEAIVWLIKSLKIRKADDAFVARIQKAYEDAGWPGVLRERLAADDGMNYCRQAGMHARLGNIDAAFELLNTAYEQDFYACITLRVEPQFDPLRGDPRFSELVKRMESGAR